MKVVVIGCTHAGTSAVKSILKEDPSAEVVVFERNDNVSFLSCGIALYIGEVVKKAEELWNYIQAFVSKDKREKNKKDYFDKGNLKNQYDQAFLMTFIANKNLIENSTSNNESNIINQMMKRLINNLLDSMEDVDEDRIKEMFIKQCDMIKKDNIRKSNNIKGILVERFKRENSSIDSVFNNLKGE